MKVADNAGDTPIHEGLGHFSPTRTCQSLGIPSIGLDELRIATSPRGKADMRQMADLAGPGHFLVLRF